MKVMNYLSRKCTYVQTKVVLLVQEDSRIKTPRLCVPEEQYPCCIDLSLAGPTIYIGDAQQIVSELIN